LEELEFQRRLEEFRKPWPICTPKKTVATVLLSLRDVATVDQLERLARVLLGAPLRPALTRVLLPTESAAHELAARFRGELRPAGLRHRVRDRCLLIAEEEDTVDGSHQLLDIAPLLIRKVVNSMVLVSLPTCFGVWDTLVRVGLPSGASTADADALVADVGSQVGAALDPSMPEHGAVSRMLLLASEPQGRNPRLYHGTHPSSPAIYINGWLDACAKLGVDVSTASQYDDPRLLVAGWLDSAQ